MCTPGAQSRAPGHSWGRGPALSPAAVPETRPPPGTAACFSDTSCSQQRAIRLEVAQTETEEPCVVSGVPEPS